MRYGPPLEQTGARTGCSARGARPVRRDYGPRVLGDMRALQLDDYKMFVTYVIVTYRRPIAEWITGQVHGVGIGVQPKERSPDRRQMPGSAL